MNLIPLRDNYRKELINTFYEKANILLNTTRGEKLNELCYDNIFRVASISGVVTTIMKVDNQILVDVDYCEYEWTAVQPEQLDTTTLERFVFNHATAYRPTDGGKYIKID